jgi:cell volume regulation protein A
MSLDEFNLLLLVGAALLLLSVAAVRVAVRVGIPSLLGYLALGMLIGEAGLGVRFDDHQLAQNLGLAALVVILAEGGFSAHWVSLRRGLPAAVSLSTVGVAVSIAITSVAAHALLGTTWQVAVLLGAITASTDAAAIFSILRGLPLRRDIASILEAESGTNDPIVVIVVLAVSSGGWVGKPIVVIAGLVLWEMVAGAAVGLLLGWVGARALPQAALPATGLYPLAVLALLVIAYASAAAVHASGFLAVYVGAVLLGKSRLPHRQATTAFIEGLAWLAQIGLFVMLGLLASPRRLPAVILPAIAVGVVLLLVARPVSVVIATVRQLRLADQLFVAWAGLRGAVPIVFATIPLTHDVADGVYLFDLVFVLVVVFTLVQGRSLPAVARSLRVEDRAGVSDVQVDAAPLDVIDADLLQLRIPEGSQLHGVTVRALRLPELAVLSLLIRDGESCVPEPDMRLRAGDQLLIVASAGVRESAERRLRAVGRRGELAGWFGEHGDE